MSPAGGSGRSGPCSWKSLPLVPLCPCMHTDHAVTALHTCPCSPHSLSLSLSAPQWPSTSSCSTSRTSSMEGSPSGSRPTAISTATPLHARGRPQNPAAGHIDPVCALTPDPSPQEGREALVICT